MPDKSRPGTHGHHPGDPAVPTGAAAEASVGVPALNARQEMHAAPPFLTWRAIYAIVLCVLGAEVALYAFLTAIYRR